jgi:hypothetical protein
MTNDTEFKLNGHKSEEALEGTASDEDLEVVKKKLSDLTRGESPLISLSKTDIPLLKSMLQHPDKVDSFTQIVQICDFLDEGERNRELNAYYESIRLGMDPSMNIAHALSCASINRKGAHVNSRVAALLDSLSHQKITSNMPQGSRSGSKPNSPLG